MNIIKEVLRVVVFIEVIALIFVFGMGIGSILPQYREVYASIVDGIVISLVSIGIGFVLGKRFEKKLAEV